MNVEDFNKKYEKYLEDGHYGLDIYNDEVILYLDKEFEEEIKINKNFYYSQIKLKFGMSRVYANSDKTSVWEDEIDRLLSTNKHK